MPAPLYHGGPPWLLPGDFILPPDDTGAATTARYGAAPVCRTDRVYVTPDLRAASVFAAFHPSGKGQVYRVTVDGPLAPDPDCAVPGLSFEAERAEIVEVIRMTKAERRAIREAFLNPETVRHAAFRPR